MEISKNLTIKVGFVALAAIALQGCGSTVDCNASDTKETALKIINQNLDKARWYNEIKPSLSGSPKLINIKTVSQDKDLKTARCNAVYSLNYNGRDREIDVQYHLSYLQDKGEAEVRVDVDSVKFKLMGLVAVEGPIKTSTPDVPKVSQPGPQKIEACVDNWMAAFRKENGEDAPVRTEQLDEWEAWCKDGRLPSLR